MLNADKHIFFVVANLIAHVVNARSLEVDEAAAGAAVLAKHLLSFRDRILGGDVDRPALESLVQVAQTKAPQFKNTGLKVDKVLYETAS